MYKNAFSMFPNLETIDIPDTIEEIDAGTFDGCHNLTEVTIPSGVKKIKDATFQNCFRLKTVEIPDGVNFIGNYAFAGCGSLTDITIPSNVTELGAYAFQDCGSISNIDIPDGVTEINEFTFQNCKALKNVNLHDGITSIGYAAFSGSGITSVKIPESVTSIGDNAFTGCDNLTEVVVPEDTELELKKAFTTECVKTTSGKKMLINPEISGTTYDVSEDIDIIGRNAFEGSALTTINIPESVTKIDKKAFYSCSNLKEVHYAKTESDWEYNVTKNEYWKFG